MRYTTVEDLSFQYGDEPVLRGINYRLDSEEFVTLTGENGTTKSTLVKTILNILTPKSDQVTISKTNKKGKKLRTAYLSQQIASFNAGFPSTVYEFVKSGCYPRNGWSRRPIKHGDEHVKVGLESAGMWKDRHKRIGSLPGGQKQRVVITRTFASDPDTSILDESTTGVDAGTTGTFCESVHHRAHEHGKSVLIIIHDPDEAKHCADRNTYLIRNQRTPWRCFNMCGTDMKGAVSVN